MNRWKRLSFYQRIRLAFIVFLLVPLLVVTVVSYWTTKNAITDRVAAANQNMVQVIANDLEKTVDNVAYASVYFAQINQPNVLESFRVLKAKERFDTYEDYDHYDRLNQYADILLVQTLDVNLRMFVLNQKKLMIMGNLDQAVFSHVMKELESIQPDMNDRQTLQWFKVSEKNSDDFYFYAVRVIQDPVNKEVLATLYVGIPSSYFAQLFHQAQTGGFLLSDENGRRIASGGNAFQPLKVRPNEVIVTEHHITRTGWTLQYFLPEREVTGEISRGFLWTAVMFSLAAIVFLTVSLFAAKSLSKPIAELKNIAKRYVGGNRSARFQVEGPDEMAMLGSSFNHMLDHINELIVRVQTEQEEKRKIELEALFTQIRPHFLINTLNSIKCNLAVAGDHHHSRMIDALMVLLRSYMKVYEPATLEQEMNLIRHYVDIMNMRNRMNVQLHCNVPDEFLNMEIPRLLIQPLIENAFIHAFEDHPQDAHIHVVIIARNNVLEIWVADNGIGMEEDGLRELTKGLSLGEIGGRIGIGLSNIVKRIQLTYGKRAALVVRKNEGPGLTFVIELPKQQLWKGDDGHV